MKLRHEHFGAIIALDDPPALVHVDREMVRELGFDESPRWADDAPPWLRAPTEVHLMTTNRCPAGCPGCYTSAVPEADDAPTERMKDTLRSLAEAGVFHVALGGGESLLRPDLFDLAAFARELGLIPNLTTSGIGMNAERARACRVFGQVNVSLDGLGETYRQSRGYDGAGRALRALELLHAAEVPCGINYVVCRQTWDAMEETVAEVARIGVNEVEFLRYKPAGRARTNYAARRLHEAQARALLPRLLELGRRFPDVHMKVDCSFVPFLCAADPDPGQLSLLGVIGCEAGHVLAAVKADLQATPCSFVDQPLGEADVFVHDWDRHPDLLRWRRYADEAPEPCRSCAYRDVCRGGCKVVTMHEQGRWFAPDPECPRVLAHARGEPFVPVSMEAPDA